MTNVTSFGERACTGILIANLGTPEAPTRPALRRYLAEFLADPRVVELPRLLWLPVLHGILLNVRPQRSAKAYASIWWEDGSPLLRIAEKQTAAIEEALSGRLGTPFKVALGMRYGSPSIESALDDLREAGARRILVVPMYPQYSATTVGSTFDAVADALKKWRWVPDLRFVSHYHEDPQYIGALANSVREHWAEHGQPQKLVISFHGVPEAYIKNGDPYLCESRRTAELLADELGLSDEQWMVAFQSRLGPVPWLAPYLDQTLEALPEEGITDVQVICPGFSADCLETLEEVAEEGCEAFHEAGGERFSYIPALNDRPDHIAAITDLVVRHAQGWVTPDQAYCFDPTGCDACSLAHVDMGRISAAAD